MPSPLAHPFVPLPLFGGGPMVIPTAAPSTSSATKQQVMVGAGKRPLPSSDGVPFTVTPILPAPAQRSLSPMASSVVFTPPPAKRSKSSSSHHQNKKNRPSDSSASSTMSSSSPSTPSTWKPSRPPLMPLALQPSAANIFPSSSSDPMSQLFMKCPPPGVIMMGPPPAAAPAAASPTWSPARQLENQLLLASPPPAACSPLPAATPTTPRQRILRIQP